MLSTQNIGEKCRIPFNVISNLHCIDVRLMSDAQTPTHTAHPFLSSLVQCHLVGPNFSLTVYKMHFCVVCYPWLWQFAYVCSARTNNVRVHVALSLCLSSSHFDISTQYTLVYVQFAWIQNNQHHSVSTIVASVHTTRSVDGCMRVENLCMTLLSHLAFY